MGLKFECLAAFVAFVIAAVFILVPGPYPMVLFTFVGVPLFGIAALLYLGRVLAELRKKDVL
jgi:hypothetical protein